MLRSLLVLLFAFPAFAETAAYLIKTRAPLSPGALKGREARRFDLVDGYAAELTAEAVELALRLDHHFAEWDVLDRVSGRTAQTGDYTAYGLHVGFGTRF